MTAGMASSVMVQPDWSAIASEMPGLVIRTALPIGEGWMTIAYRVNDELVFRFPKRPSVWSDLDREIEFLAYARPHLALPAPEHLHRVRKSAGAPHGYVVARNIPGRAVDPGALAPPERAELARVLARFLRTLHDMDPGPVAPILPYEDEYTNALQHQRDAKVEVAPDVSRVERRRLREAFAGHLSDPLNFGGRPRILHADFSADHILCVGHGVTGILDWGDVCLGDPDYDFGYLYEEFGEAFIREVASYYGHADPDRLVRKARYFTIAEQIGTIVHGGDEALPGDVDRSWVRLREVLNHRA